MKACPYCKHENREGVLLCEVCGKPLHAKAPDVTLPFAPAALRGDVPPPKAPGATLQAGQDTPLLIHIQGAAQPVVLQPNQRVVLGRVDTTMPQQPDVDLTSYQGQEKGVSRIHAAIERTGETVTVVDLGSTNGTYVNGEKLVPHQPRVLRGGEEIRLGKLVVSAATPQ
jgi:pSer/pThr/pTyr-binding forkhead associated (FHA) protein